MKSLTSLSGLVAATLTCGACEAKSDPMNQKPQSHDISKENAQLNCKETHNLIGQSFEFTTLAHGVSGVVTVVDDCTLVLMPFNYDGKGLQVEVYGFLGESEGVSLSLDLLRPSKSYADEELTLRLPEGLTFDDFDRISIWCVEAGSSFGDALLTDVMK